MVLWRLDDNPNVWNNARRDESLIGSNIAGSTLKMMNKAGQERAFYIRLRINARM